MNILRSSTASGSTRPETLTSQSNTSLSAWFYFQTQSEKLAAEWHDIGAAISLITLILSILYLIYDWRKNRRKDGTNWKTEQKPLEMPKIVTKTVGAINDRSRLIIKRRSNPELKALHNHVVHERQGYHYHKKKTIREFLEDLKEKLTKKKM